MRALIAVALALCATSAVAQVNNPPVGVPTASQVQQAAQEAQAAKALAQAVQAAMPQRADTLPPAEQVTPTLGTSMRYRGADDPTPRITRAVSCTLVSGGTCSVTYAALAQPDPNVIPIAINNGQQAISCGPSAIATTTSASIKCFMTQSTNLTLAIVTAGLSLIPATTAPAGTVVQITLLPKSGQ